MKRIVLWCCWIFLVSPVVQAQSPRQITIKVVDENNVPVSDARVAVTNTQGADSRCQTVASGRCDFFMGSTGPYKVKVEREGFYSATANDVQFDPNANVEFTLVHVQEVREVVNVVESQPAINPEQIVSQEQISGVDVLNLPYPVTRDYRNVLNYVPQVVEDIFRQPHITGAETYQTRVLFDGSDVTQPANGQLLLRVSTDAFRSINVQTSRIAAQYGKSSGGVLELNTANGDDHFRFAVTDFIPSLQNRNGPVLDKVNPRLTFSGPIRKGRIWFYEAADAEYANIIEKQLPPGMNHDVYWRVGNLFKLQANTTSRNILISSVNFNYDHDQHAGMSLQNPPLSTPAVTEPMYLASLKDQYYFPSGRLLETGFAFNRYDLDQNPRGTEPYFINPDTAGGNYYLRAHTQADRWQIYANLSFKPQVWHGNHQFKVGVDLDRLRYDFNFQRQTISYLRDVEPLPPSGCQTIVPSPCSRYSEFTGPSLGEIHDAELSAYAQDRWLVTNRLLVEAGLRFDWDELVRDPLFSPRLAGTYALRESGNTKLSAGIGIFYDATPLFLFARPEAGGRTDFFYDSAGALTSGPVSSIFTVNRSSVEAPRYVNWSVGLEQKLPWQIYFKSEFIQRRGSNGLAFNWINPVELGPPGVENYLATFQLQNGREDRFDSFEIKLRRVFEKGHTVMASYIRSKTYSTQVLDFNVDNPIFSTQRPGPYGWDAPNRFLSWGFLPLIKGFDFGYSMESRTGFPFYLVDNQQQLASLPGTEKIPTFMRFPAYFTLNTHLEKRFHAFGFYWAVRGGFDNVTAHKNYGFVNNNVDSPQFLTLSGFTGRSFTGRIRILGRK
jgi:outer membrane receptor protein involved in Fe transport